MKKITPIFILAVALLSGCCRIETYTHKPTQGIRTNISKKSFKKTTEFQRDGILFVPCFYSFTRSYSLPDSAIILYSQTKAKIHIEKAVLFSASRSHQSELPINKTVEIDELCYKSPIYGETVLLFDEKNTDLKVFWDEGTIFLKLYFINPSTGKSEDMIFEINHREYSDIAWPT
jgi:hypothetical protein